MKTIIKSDKACEFKKTLFISKKTHLHYLNNSYARLYFGQEFCERLIPPLPHVQDVLEFCERRNIPLTYVTPLVSNEGIACLKSHMQLFNDYNPCNEIVFNDWGVFHLFSKIYPRFNFIMGRLLIKQMRDPRIRTFLPQMDNMLQEFLKSNSISIPIMQEFLIVNNIRRVEYDNLFHGVSLPVSEKFGFSLYYPYNFVSVTRICPAAQCTVLQERKLIAAQPCSQECQQFDFILKDKKMPCKIILKGNTYFIKNTKINIEGGYIDRLIEQPEIPI